MFYKDGKIRPLESTFATLEYFTYFTRTGKFLKTSDLKNCGQIFPDSFSYERREREREREREKEREREREREKEKEK